MKGVLVDTSFWFALAVAADANHLHAARTARALQKRGKMFLTTVPILAETHRLLLYKLGAWAADRFLAQIAKQVEAGFLCLLPVGWEEVDAARAWLAKYADLNLTLTDATSAVIMRASGITIYAGYDRHFLLLGFTPAE